MKETYLDNKIKSSCNGCGACSLICPVNAITMLEDGEGFLYPVIDESKCIKCNKCRHICGNYNDKKENNEKAYISINNSKEQLLKSSSGGMFYILAEYVTNKQGVVCGVTYNENLEAVHEFAESLEECQKFCGSKYIRSNLQDVYIKTKDFLDNNRYVLFTGTACQISGLQSFLGKDYEKLILCDILCHANPSPKVFKLYIQNLEKLKNKKVKTVYFRSKENGWRNQTPIIEYDDGEKIEEKSYFKAFVKELINRQSCYTCPFASKRRISDFTIGDMWGIEKIDSDINTSNGVSLLTVNSVKGNQVFNDIKNRMSFQEVDYDLACSYNHYNNVQVHRKREQFFKNLSNGKINNTNIITYMNKFNKIHLYKKVIRKLKSIIHRKEIN
ncbi:MAG: 4Fe-4S binding protein [Clostridia bacterium]|nr:4Fe-4S binding protein [Clostridia bacterium]